MTDTNDRLLVAGAAIIALVYCVAALHLPLELALIVVTSGWLLSMTVARWFVQRDRA